MVMYAIYMQVPQILKYLLKLHFLYVCNANNPVFRSNVALGK